MTWLGPDTGWMDLHMLYIETVWAGELAVCANHMDCGQMDAIDTGLAILEISLCRVSIPNICALGPQDISRKLVRSFSLQCHNLTDYSPPSFISFK